MADIPSEENRIQLQETQFRAAVAESTLTRIGASINWLLDKVGLLDQKNIKQIQFTSNTTWVVPPNVGWIEIVACGGGGAGGPARSGGSNGSGGGGGYGAPVYLFGLPVTPGQVFNFTVGAGQVGPASSGFGGTTTIQSGSFLVNCPGGRAESKPFPSSPINTPAFNSVSNTYPLVIQGGMGGWGSQNGAFQNGTGNIFAGGGTGGVNFGNNASGGGGASLGKGGGFDGPPGFGGGGRGLNSGGQGVVIVSLFKE
jgi:hypothetical protein